MGEKKFGPPLGPLRGPSGRQRQIGMLAFLPSPNRLKHAHAPPRRGAQRRSVVRVAVVGVGAFVSGVVEFVNEVVEVVVG